MLSNKKIIEKIKKYFEINNKGKEIKNYIINNVEVVIISLIFLTNATLYNEKSKYLYLVLSLIILIGSWIYIYIKVDIYIYTGIFF